MCNPEHTPPCTFQSTAGWGEWAKGRPAFEAFASWLCTPRAATLGAPTPWPAAQPWSGARPAPPVRGELHHGRSSAIAVKLPCRNHRPLWCSSQFYRRAAMHAERPPAAVEDPHCPRSRSIARSSGTSNRLRSTPQRPIRQHLPRQHDSRQAARLTVLSQRSA